jgi:hypothetical protein
MDFLNKTVTKFDCALMDFALAYERTACSASMQRVCIFGARFPDVLCQLLASLFESSLSHYPPCSSVVPFPGLISMTVRSGFFLKKTIQILHNPDPSTA